MTDRRLMAVVVMLGIGLSLSARPAPPTATKPRDFTTITKFVEAHCIGCHGPKKQSGSMSLHQYKSIADIVKDRSTWDTVIERVRNKEMPPKSKPQPSDADRDAFVAFVEAELSTATCSGPPNPGRVTLRRLNRAEYNNTIRDLFGMSDLHPADDFPLDDVGYGFDNIGDVLSLSTLLMEKYLIAADRTLERVFIKVQKVASTTRVFEARERDFVVNSKGSVLLPENGGRVFTQAGDMIRTYKFEHAGEYLFKIRAQGQGVLGEQPKLTFKVDGKDIKTFEIRGGGPNNRKGPGYEATVKLTAGEHRFGVAFINPKTDPNEADPKLRDRNVKVVNLELQGPMNPPPPESTDGFKRIFIAKPDANTKFDEAARKTITAFARRAYRRPATVAEIESLVKLAALGSQNGETYEDSVKLAVKAILVSPNFLFRAEADRGTPGQPNPISDLELASRLSYFLWSSMPDDELLRLAQFDQLREKGNLEKQVRRMLKDPKARALADNFAGQWLQTRNLASSAVDPGTFPTYDTALRLAMVEETMLFFDAIVREDRDILDFLDADFTFVNERLAKHYGLPGVRGAEFRKVSLKGTPRGGILTHASILTVTSNPTRTSPVKRGKFILENILGATMPPPPPDVPDLDQGAGHELKGSLRQRMEQHRTNPNCATCHDRMDPPGFAFENFDGIGAYRDKDGKFPIDASGSLADGKTFKNPAELRSILKEKPEAFRRCLADKLLTYALGRGLEHFDRCATDEIGKKAATGGNRFSSLVIAVAQSEPFQKRMTAAKESR